MNSREIATKLIRLQALIRRNRTGVVYVATHRRAVNVFRRLCRAVPEVWGVQILLYHGAMSESCRALVREEFRTAAHVVVVATQTFEMDVVRAERPFVVHWDRQRVSARRSSCQTPVKDSIILI